MNLLKTALATLLLGAFTLAAQQPTTPPDKPAPQAPPPVSDWERSHQEQLRTDWPWLARYQEADVKLAAPASGENRVVFMGDSITEGWHFEGADGSFPGKPYINRGISGQTSPQMLVRFRQDVIALRPKVVVILAGTNDIAGNTGPVSLAEIEDNFASMAELARAHGIRVVFSSVIPVHNYTPASAITFPLRPPAQIVALNRWLKDYAAANGGVYLDYFAAMIDEHGLLRRELAGDGLHPTKAGFAIMAPLAEQAIDRALHGG